MVSNRFVMFHYMRAFILEVFAFHLIQQNWDQPLGFLACFRGSLALWVLFRMGIYYRSSSRV